MSDICLEVLCGTEILSVETLTIRQRRRYRESGMTDGTSRYRFFNSFYIQNNNLPILLDATRHRDYHVIRRLIRSAAFTPPKSSGLSNSS